MKATTSTRRSSRSDKEVAEIRAARAASNSELEFENNSEPRDRCKELRRCIEGPGKGSPAEAAAKGRTGMTSLERQAWRNTVRLSMTGGPC